MEKLLNLIFVPTCLFCKTEGDFFCDKCLASCSKFPIKICKTKKFPAKFLFIYEYARFIRECIRESKYRHKHFASLKVLSKKTLADPTISGLLKHFCGTEKCLVLPIPVSSDKLKKRGFNQAELIAQKLTRKLGAYYRTDVLFRKKATIAQYTNTRNQRFANLKGAFEVKLTHAVGGRKIILVDDVCTTGATFIEATKVLLAAGATEVLCFALARKSLTRR